MPASPRVFREAGRREEQLENEARTETVHVLCFSISSFSWKHTWLLRPQAGRLHTVDGIGQKQLKIL